MSSTNYENTTGTNPAGYDKTAAQGGYRDEDTGRFSNAQPAGGVPSNLSPDEARIFGAQPTAGGQVDSNAYANQNAPLYGGGETAGDAAVAGPGPVAGAYGNQHHLRHDAEGAALGGVAGHEYGKHHAGGPGAGTGAALGAVGGHEYNEHHHQHHGNRVDAGPQSNATAADHRLGTAGAAAGAAAVADHEHHKHHHQHHQGNQGNLGGYSDLGQDPSQGYGGSNLSAGNAGSAGNRVDAGLQSNATAADHHLGTAGAAGAVAGHEYNKHHHHNQGAGYSNTDNTTGRHGHNPTAGTNNAGTTASGQTEADAKSLQRSGKIDKIVGTLLGSTSMKEKGLQKQADAAAIRSEVNNYNNGQPGRVGDNYSNTNANANVNGPNAGAGAAGAGVGGGVGGGAGGGAGH